MEVELRAEDDDSRAKEMKAFYQSWTGVKGLLDSGITDVPSFFINPPATSSPNATSTPQLQIPVIDMEGVETDQRRTEIVDAIRDAAQTWGFFRIFNHGVPINLMDNMLDAVRRFHEQPQELKKAWYTSNEINQRVFDYDMKVAAAWRDTVSVEFPDGELNEQSIPEVCRNVTSEYMKHMLELKETLSELLSEALGLRRDYLASSGGMNGALIAFHYYPACPQPELTIGAATHTDASFLTILLESDNDGLQVLHRNQWVDVPYRRGYLTVNIGDLLQIVSNDKFKSVNHRVLAGRMGPRTSAPCFFVPAAALKDKPYGPAEQLVSAEDPAIYKATSFHQYYPYFRLNGRDGRLVLPHFKI
ncbi:hypothetical protein like AT1G06620 [Hibiscus trionum]|uniref:Fe2OG dioxygenase domain-containing protein n=1 Tax=Hibiscus trionum TaxID=183268 RepID=A0A9W7IK66_HIBTR|nr:hypothetical protein like AT1G06620 [Hibiscus trionum]